MNKQIIRQLFIFLLVISIPYLISIIFVPKEYHFTGFLANPIDGHSYLSKMQEGRNGDWLFKLPYSKEQGDGVFLFTYYIFLGHIARTLSLPNIIVFHAARLINAALLFFMIYVFIKNHFKPDRINYAIALIIFGSGLGWILLLFGYPASDIKIPEIYPLLASYSNPHFPLAIGLMLLNFKLFLSEIRYKLIALFFLSVALTIIQPFCMVILLGVLGILTLVEWHEISKSRIYSLISLILPTIIFGTYLLYITKYNASIRGWNSQNITPSPPVWDLMISLSPMFLLAIPGIYNIIKTKDRQFYPLVIWMGMALSLAYLPANLQRRLLIGSYIPVAILGLYGMNLLINSTGKYWSLIRITIFAIALPTNLLILSMSVYQVANFNQNLVMKQNVWKSLLWVNHNIPQDSLIITSPEVGLYIPAYSNNRVIYGHPFETTDAILNKGNVELFFTSMSSSEQQHYLMTEDVDYILVNSDSGYDFQPSLLISGNLVYNENEINIYKVNK